MGMSIFFHDLMKHSIIKLAKFLNKSQFFFSPTPSYNPIITCIKPSITNSYTVTSQLPPPRRPAFAPPPLLPTTLPSNLPTPYLIFPNLIQIQTLPSGAPIAPRGSPPRPPCQKNDTHSQREPSSLDLNY